MVTKFSEKFAIIMLKKLRKFCRRGLTNLDATPTFQKSSKYIGDALYFPSFGIVYVSYFSNFLRSSFLKFFKSFLQLIIHETDLLFRNLSRQQTWHCSSISEDLQRFARNLGLIIENMGLSHIQLAVFQINLDIFYYFNVANT